MSISILASDLRKSSSSYKELFNDGTLTVYSINNKFEVNCGSTHTVCASLKEVAEKVDSLPLHIYAKTSDSVVSEIKNKLAKHYRFEVIASKNEKETTVHTVEGTKEVIANSLTGMVNANVMEMVPGRRYSCNGSVFGGDYMLLIPVTVDEGFDFDVSGKMYEPQVVAKGIVMTGINPIGGESFSILIDEVYPNGAFKDSEGKIYSKEDAELYKFQQGQPISEEESQNFSEPSESLFESEDLPSYNPTGEVAELAPNFTDLSNYDNILSASAGILADFMKTAKGVAYIDRSSLNKIRVSAINKEGKATDGEVEWNVRLSSPKYRRSSQITVPLVMKAGSIDLGTEFITSTGAKMPLTVEALSNHLGELVDDDFTFSVKGSVYPSTLHNDSDIDFVVKSSIDKRALDFSSILPILQSEKFLDDQEVQNVLRLSLSAEEDATQLYETISKKLKDENFRKLFQDVADEEKVHVGEFEALLDIVDPTNKELTEKGKEEAESKVTETETKTETDKEETDKEETDKVKESSMNKKAKGWDVYLKDELIDTVFDDSEDAEDVKRSLINHDGYDPAIEVRGSKKAANFRDYCRTLTDNQVLNVLEKEKEASETDEDRMEDYLDAKAEAESRGILGSKKTASYNLINDTEIDNYGEAIANYWDAYPNNKVLDEKGNYVGEWQLFTNLDGNKYLVITDNKGDVLEKADEEIKNGYKGIDLRAHWASKKTANKAAYSGRYITLTELDNGNLSLTLTKEGEEELLEKGENINDDEKILQELLEDAFGNGWTYIYPEQIDALTNAPIIGYDVDIDDKGVLVNVDKVWWYPNYQVTNPIEVMLREGSVEFISADENGTDKTSKKTAAYGEKLPLENPEAYAADLETSIQAIFPEGKVSVKYDENLTYSITIRFTSKSTYENNIAQNDPAYTLMFIYGRGDKLQVTMQAGGLRVKPSDPKSYFAFEKHPDVKFRSKTGTPEQVKTHILNYFENLKTVIDSLGTEVKVPENKETAVEASKKTATGEPDQDYDHEIYDKIVEQLAEAGFPNATHKEFDKYQGVYLRVPKVDTFWIIEEPSYFKDGSVVLPLQGEKNNNLKADIIINEDNVDSSELIEVIKGAGFKPTTASKKTAADNRNNNSTIFSTWMFTVGDNIMEKISDDNKEFVREVIVNHDWKPLYDEGLTVDEAVKQFLDDRKRELDIVSTVKVAKKFKYTGDYNVDFNDEHPLLPDMIIDRVATQRSESPEKTPELIIYLTEKFSQIYKNNEKFAQSILNGRGDSGRDTMYSFLNHWVDGKEAKANPSSKVAYTSDGSDITETAQKVMDIDSDTWLNNGWQQGNDVKMDVLKEALKGISAKVTDKDIEVLEDYNFHSAVEAINQLKGKK